MHCIVSCRIGICRNLPYHHSQIRRQIFHALDGHIGSKHFIAIGQFLAEAILHMGMLLKAADQIALFVVAIFCMGMLGQTAQVGNFHYLFCCFQACIRMGMLGNFADQVALCIEAFLGVGMFFQAAQVRNLFYFLCCLQACIRMGMLGQLTDEVALCIVAQLIVSMLFQAAQIDNLFDFGFFIGLPTGQQTVTQDVRIGQLVSTVGNGIAGVALDGLHFIAVYFHHKAHMVGGAILVGVEEDQIGRFRFILTSCPEHVPLGQSMDPVVAVAIQGEAFQSGIVQTEGHIHGTPVAVGAAVPVAVTGVTLHGLAVGFHDIVLGAFVIAQLALGNDQNILFRIAGQFQLGDHSIPVCLGFHIRLGIGEADQGMVVFFQFANQGFLGLGQAFLGMLVHGCVCDGAVYAAFVVDMGCNLLFFAGHHRFYNGFCPFFLGAGKLGNHFIAGIAMGMAFLLFLTAAQNLLIAGAGVGMAGILRRFALEGLLLGVAAVPVAMGGLLFLLALQRLFFAVAACVMAVSSYLSLAALQCLLFFIAIRAMGMGRLFLQTAVCGLGFDVAACVMAVGSFLFLLASQLLFLAVAIAAVAVAFGLFLVADQIAIGIIAIGTVGMALAFLLFAGQLFGHGVAAVAVAMALRLFLVAGQLGLGNIAAVAVAVAGSFLLLTAELRLRLIAIITMAMAGSFLGLAAELGLHIIAAVPMAVAFALFGGAGQFAADIVAAVPMGMAFPLSFRAKQIFTGDIAAVTVGMAFLLGNFAQQSTPDKGITILPMGMGLMSYLGIAAFIMHMAG